MLGLAILPKTDAVLAIDFGKGQVLSVNPEDGTSSVCITLPAPGTARRARTQKAGRAKVATKSEIVSHLIKENKVKVVAARYDLENGHVEFLS